MFWKDCFFVFAAVIQTYSTQMHAVAGLGNQVLFAVRGILSTRGGHFRLFLRPPGPSSSAAPGGGLPGACSRVDAIDLGADVSQFVRTLGSMPVY